MLDEDETPAGADDGSGDAEGSNAVLAASIRNVPFAMVLTNPNFDDNPIVYVNDAFERVTFYSRAFAVGRNCRFLQGKDSDPDEIAKLREGIAAGHEVSVDLTNYKADGTPFRNRLLIAPIRDGGRIGAFLGVQMELNDEGEPEEAPAASGGAKRSDAARSSEEQTSATEGAGGTAMVRSEDAEPPLDAETMLRELQHRVRNHLAMVVGMIRMQASRDITPDAFRALSHRVESLALLYQELSPAGVSTARADTISAGSYLSRVASTLNALAGRASIRVNVECEEIDLPIERGARLGLILTELLTNALDHAFEDRDEGVVRIRLQELTGGGMRLMVEDDGGGLPEGSTWPANAKSIARQKREDAEATASDAGGHSGMGGSIVKSLSDSLDGKLSVSSSDRGTIVILDFDGAG